MQKQNKGPMGLHRDTMTALARRFPHSLKHKNIAAPTTLFETKK